MSISTETSDGLCIADLLVNGVSWMSRGEFWLDGPCDPTFDYAADCVGSSYSFLAPSTRSCTYGKKKKSEGYIKQDYPYKKPKKYDACPSVLTYDN